MSKKTKLSDHFNDKNTLSFNNELNVLNPECKILINKQKRKVYGKKKNKIYLNDNDNIQINIFNTLNEKIGVQIEFNGKLEENILVVNPGQKIMLDRFMDSKRKIKFSTYFVDGNDNRTKEAIKKNGDIKIFFWKEDTIYYNINNNTNYFNFVDGTFHENYTTYTKGSDTSSFISNISSNSSNDPSLLETGRMEKGEKSNQKMKKTDFVPSFVFYTLKYKLLPFSKMKKKNFIITQKV